MIRLANIRESAVAAQIHALQQAAYAVEAERIGCADFPPLRETVEVLQGSTDRFLVFLDNENIVGCLSYESVGTKATITRLVVSPQHFRRGIATALLRALDGRLPIGSAVYASTADSNVPAIRAYEKHGYRTVSRKVSSEGIALRRLHKLVVLLIAASLLIPAGLCHESGVETRVRDTTGIRCLFALRRSGWCSVTDAPAVAPLWQLRQSSNAERSDVWYCSGRAARQLLV
jgi:ribosomal protein S18 acetylase RimI-like enzyme